MKNYLMLNGKRIDLTEEQIKTLGFEVKKDYFERGGRYFYITAQGNVTNDFDTNVCLTSACRYKVGNYCTDRKIMEQRALHETLDRLLWRFSMQNDGDKIDWNNYFIDECVFAIDIHSGEPSIMACPKRNKVKYINNIYFYTKEIAQRAIDEIIKPFMKEHPEFVW